MWDRFRKQDRLCVQYREALEDLPPTMIETAAIAELKISLPAEAVAHAAECDVCEEAAAIFWASRNMLAGTLQLSAGGQPENYETVPWFVTRVMATIAEHETQMRAASAEWTGAVSRLASRLAWVSALALLVASSWVYDLRPRGSGEKARTLVGQAATEAPQYLFDSTTAPSNADDALASSIER
jgi:hypothetical protein